MGKRPEHRDSNGGNNTGPQEGELVTSRRSGQRRSCGVVPHYDRPASLNPDLFSGTAQYSNLCQAWSTGRTITAVNGDKELYCVINPNVTGNITVTVDFLNPDNGSYRVASKSYASGPTFDAAAPGP